MEKENTKEKPARNAAHSAAGGYIEAVGRRKTSTARVRITSASKGHFIVNNKEAREYFKTEVLRRLILDPMAKGLTGEQTNKKWSVEARVSGGGVNSQAEAIRLGLSRALVREDGELRPALKTLGFLKRDARAKERRKFGLKKARKAPQWSKR